MCVCVCVCVCVEGGGGGGGTPIQEWRGCSSYLLGVENAVFVPLTVFSLKLRSTTGAFGLRSRVLNRKNMAGENALCKVFGTYLGRKKIQARATKADLATS